MKIVNPETIEGDVICWISGGIASTLACYLYAKNSPDKQIRFVTIAIPGSEHPDHHRFVKEIADFFGWSLETITCDKFSSHWEVLEKRRFINSAHGAPCTTVLKKQVREKFEKDNQIAVHVWGFTVEEKARLARLTTLKGANAAPLIESGFTKQQAMDEFMRITGGSIRPPILYAMGYPNANCLGCPKGGAGYWNKLRVDFPEVFERMASLEESIGATVLRKKVNEQWIRLPLRQLDPTSGRNKPIDIPDCSLDGCEISKSIQATTQR